MTDWRTLIADAALIELGCSVWATPPSDDPDLPRRGGLVCKIDHWDRLDQETGEVDHHLTFRCRQGYGEPLTYWLLDSSEIDPSQTEPLDRRRATVIVRRIASALARTKRGGITPNLTATECEAIADAYRLLVGGTL